MLGCQSTIPSMEILMSIGEKNSSPVTLIVGEKINNPCPYSRVDIELFVFLLRNIEKSKKMKKNEQNEMQIETMEGLVSEKRAA